jgi:hypothetical protein
MERPMPVPRRAPPGCARALAELRTQHLDTLAGYDKLLEIAEPEFRQIAADFRALHIRHSELLAALLIAEGHDPSQDGSIFGRVNRAVLVLRAWFDDISTNLWDALVEGEMRVLEATDEAIEAALDLRQRRVLLEMRVELVTLLERHAP